MSPEEKADSLPRALFDRYGREHTTATWGDLIEADRRYWRREAEIVRRAVARAARAARADRAVNPVGYVL